MEIISENNAAACLDEKWMKEYKKVPQQLVNAQANIPIQRNVRKTKNCRRSES